MATFPRTPAADVALAQEMVTGLTANAAIYADPPEAPANLTARNAAVAAQAHRQDATAAKDVALAALTDALKRDIRYAENTVGGDDAKLKLIGSRRQGRRAGAGRPRPVPHARSPAPGRRLGLPRLRRCPIDGGKPAAYTVQRRERPSGPWADVATAIESESTLSNQPRNKEFEYRVLAINKAGQGEASNTVLVVL